MKKNSGQYLNKLNESKKNVQGEPEITAKWEKKTDINSMVKRDSIIEFF